MNVLLVFFAIPFAVIVISIALEKLLDCPILVATIAFAIMLLFAIIASSTTYFILAIIYSLISFVTAWISKYMHKILRSIGNCTRDCNNEINNNCNNGNNTNTLSVNARINQLNNSKNMGTFNGCYRRR